MSERIGDLEQFYCDVCGEGLGWSTRWNLNEVYCNGGCAESIMRKVKE